MWASWRRSRAPRYGLAPSSGRRRDGSPRPGERARRHGAADPALEVPCSVPSSRRSGRRGRDRRSGLRGPADGARRLRPGVSGPAEAVCVFRAPAARAPIRCRRRPRRSARRGKPAPIRPARGSSPDPSTPPLPGSGHAAETLPRRRRTAVRHFARRRSIGVLLDPWRVARQRPARPDGGTEHARARRSSEGTVAGSIQVRVRAS
jgi:hypothetical protein